MIAPRYDIPAIAVESNSSGPAASQPAAAAPRRGKSRHTHLHLHVPERLTDVLMQLVATFGAGQRSLFSEVEFTQTEDVGEPLGVSPRCPSRATTQPAPQESQHGGLTPSRSPSSLFPVDAPVVQAPAPESLLEVYRRLLKEKRGKTASRDTVEDHETGCRLFDQFLAEKASSPVDASVTSQTIHRSGEPVYCLSVPEIIREWVDWLIVVRENSAFTINRRLIAAKMVADALKASFERPVKTEIDRRIGELRPDGRKVESKRGRLSIRADGTRLPARKIPSFNEIDAMARHVSVTRYPYGDVAPYFWRGWIRLLAFIGARSQDIVSTEFDKPGLRKSDVYWDSPCPIEDVNSALGYQLHSPHGWLWYPIMKHTANEGTRKILIPMPLWLRNWLRFFVERSWHPERVFPSCQPGCKALTQHKKTAAWDAILSASGVDPRIVESEGAGNSIAIRKLASNWWKLAVQKHTKDTALAKEMAWYVLHHAEVTVSDKHYLSTQASVLPVMLELLPSWPVPAAGAVPVSLLPE